ncbi:MAG: Glucan 1,3-beta-glucosidase 3 [Cirrosporium novae-zelandiae]|nr:MAG: Glucan 1,3-beta-glucosidase 3 [Cirrosporium novae-zelandiae]
MCSKFFCFKIGGTFQGALSTTQESPPKPVKINQTMIIPPHDTAPALQAPTILDVIRYRYHHGSNLGSIFVLERWLSGSMYLNGAKGDSELDAITASLEETGLDETRAKWESHWSTYVTDADLIYLSRTANCTTFRLPIGYFTLGPSFCAGTPFEGDASQVYVNAWSACKSLISRAYSYGIGTIIDFHAVPGGANGEGHSGTNSGKAELWGNTAHLDLAKRCLSFIAQEEAKGGLPGVAGIQLCNESVWAAYGMYQWYDDVIGAIAQAGSRAPIYISDGWDLPTALGYSQSKNTVYTQGPTNPIIVDTHKYYTFSDSDRSQSPQQIIARIPSELGELDGKDGSVVDRGACAVLIGEYSCVLDTQTWNRVPSEQRSALTQQFGHAQSARWQTRSAGCTFWTYRMDWMDGDDWGFKQQSQLGNLPPPSSLLLPFDEVRSRVTYAENNRHQLMTVAVQQHEGYWNSTSPDTRFEHWRYAAGWNVGFADAMAFYQMRADGGFGAAAKGADRIGSLDIWTLKRLRDSGQGGGFLWEWEQGFRRGVGDFLNIVGAQ